MGSPFQVLAVDRATRARAGVFWTQHGPINTPTFMPVGTQGALKGLTPDDVRTVGVQCILANTYHLWLRPGERVIRQAGGIHGFMGWDGPILTDSGGFQLLSLRSLAEINEEGARIESHLDGSLRLLSPEVAMQIQADLGSDIAMALDICPPYPCDEADLVEATRRTARWAQRSLRATHAANQAVFGIVQGGVDLALRRESARMLSALEFHGYGIGGLSVGEDRKQTWSALEAALEVLPPDRPRYFMGGGAPDDLIQGIARGVDLFDSVFPTRLGRRGSVLIANGRLELRSPSLARHSEPIDPTCDCPACVGFSLGYLHHLVRAGEELGLRLASLHNVRFLTRLAARARQAVIDGQFDAWQAAHRHGSARGGPR